ncbi:DUF6292 family protein [Umezawaea tangerina]|uniref:DUF6292 domain-containing protein n=1 Tax=Umezawaea tangerina TaxID=84725 RepID=A0A2T0T1I1_9PSEU|nr:DUF6292 family protein [Umezawaea tangerina]PRY39522.1 hypothetical protein CLV43_107105 [Umezawaea tangerina]
MDVDFDYEATQELRRHARQVSEALGLTGESWCVESERPGALYLAVDGHVPTFPDDDLALVWRERRGWSAVVERPDGRGLQEIAHLRGQVDPSPAAVAEWVAGLVDDFGALPKSA